MPSMQTMLSLLLRELWLLWLRLSPSISKIRRVPSTTPNKLQKNKYPNLTQKDCSQVRANSRTILFFVLLIPLGCLYVIWTVLSTYHIVLCIDKFLFRYCEKKHGRKTWFFMLSIDRGTPSLHPCI